MKYFLFILLLPFSLSCKKDINVGNKISANLNNSFTTFSSNVNAVIDTTLGIYRLWIFGNIGTQISTNYMLLNVLSKFPIQKGIYNGSPSPSITLGSTIEYIGNDPLTIYESKLNPNGTDNSIINITYIDSVTIQGTFSGTVYYSSNSTLPINITNGTFNARFFK